jgi:ABC-type Fe3+/spermidine/putrescine transport system ATPase subunit
VNPLELCDVDFSYPNSTEILRSFSLSLFEQEVIALLGPSGTGKTTLLKLMAGLLRPVRGRVCRWGRAIASLPPEERKIGIVFQSLALFPNLTVRQNVQFGLRQARRPTRQIEETTNELCDLLRIADLKDRRPGTLSGGQAQRVALARSLALDTELLLLDEPFSSLDRPIADLSCELIRTIHQRRKLTTVLVTHDRHYALSLATRVVVLSAEGRILEDAPPRSAYDSPRSLAGARLTGRLAEFAGTVRHSANGNLRIGLLGTELVGIARADSLREGHAVIAVARPERFEVAGGGRENTFRCRVEGPGSVDRPHDILCTAANGERFTAAVARLGMSYPVGHELVLHIDPAHLHCYPAAEVTYS